MKYLMYCLFSFPEYLSSIIFGLALFKIKINKERIRNIIIISCLITLLSLFLTLNKFSVISTPLQYVIITLMVHKMLSIKVKLSIAIIFSAITVYGAFQAGLLLLLKINEIITNTELAFTISGYLLQLSSSLIFIIISYFIIRTKEGFDYEMDTKRADKIKRYTNKLILSVVSGLFIILSCSFFEFKAFGFNLTYLFILLVIASIVLIYISLKRDTEEAEI